MRVRDLKTPQHEEPPFISLQKTCGGNFFYGEVKLLFQLSFHSPKEGFKQFENKNNLFEHSSTIYK